MLTEKQIATLKPPPGKAQLRIQDEKQRGLYLVVGATTKTWMLKRRNVWHRVGGWPALNPAAARQRVIELLAADDTGRPMGLTVKAAHDLWLKQRSGRSPRTIKANKEFLTIHFEDWQDTDLHKLTRQDVQRRHEKLSRDRGPKAANNALKAFRAWWGAAMKIDAALPAAPTISVNWHEQKPVDESVLLVRLAEWNTKLDQVIANPLRRAMFRFMLLTGLRRNDVLYMKWADISADSVFIPKPKGGEGKAFTLPLLTAHHEQLEVARPYARRGRVFPIYRARLSPVEIRKFGDLDWSAHSLRRVFISSAVEAGLTPYEIALLVNHKVPGVTFGYVAKGSDMSGAMAKVVAQLQAKLAPG